MASGCGTRDMHSCNVSTQLARKISNYVSLFVHPDEVTNYPSLKHMVRCAVANIPLSGRDSGCNRGSRPESPSLKTV